MEAGDQEHGPADRPDLERERQGVEQQGVERQGVERSGVERHGSGGPPVEAEDDATAGLLSLKGKRALSRLRDHIEIAMQELKTLREENEALSRRISELEARPAVEPDGSVVTFETDPETLRRKVEGFIEVIDRYLEEDASG